MEPVTFQAGDIVRCGDNRAWDYALTVGKTYVVLSARRLNSGGHVLVLRGDHGGEINAGSSRFAKVAPEAPAKTPAGAILDPNTGKAIDAHYQDFPISPMEFSMANKLNALQHTIVKYTVRYPLKNGLRDLYAARKALNMLIEREEKANG